MRTPNYITTKEVIINNGAHDKQTLPPGSCVRPVLKAYLPEHIKEKYKTTSEENDICFCRYGFIPINKDWIREI